MVYVKIKKKKKKKKKKNLYSKLIQVQRKEKEKFYSINFETFVKIGGRGGVANHPLGFFGVTIFRNYFTFNG